MEQFQSIFVGHWSYDHATIRPTIIFTCTSKLICSTHCLWIRWSHSGQHMAAICFHYQQLIVAAKCPVNLFLRFSSSGLNWLPAIRCGWGYNNQLCIMMTIVNDLADGNWHVQVAAAVVCHGARNRLPKKYSGWVFKYNIQHMLQKVL